MNILTVVISILLITIGLSLIFKPRLTFEIEQSLNSWRYTSEVKPSNLYLWFIRIGECVITLMGVIFLIKFI